MSSFWGQAHLGWDWDSIKKPGATPDKHDGYKPTDFDWTKPIPGGPCDNGFDYYFGDGTINFPPYAFVENNMVTEPPTEPLDLHGMETMEGNWEFRKGPMVKDWNPYNVLPRIEEKGVKWINEQKNSDKPFLLYFALPSPHAPIIPNEEFWGKTKAGGYGDYMFQTDKVAGSLLKALDKLGLSDDTIVIFSADNGPEHYAFERTSKYDHYSMGYLRGLKRDIWEGGHRIPYVVRWPGVIKPGRVSDALISQIDIFATLAGVVGYELPDDAAEDSYDQISVWKDTTEKVRVRTSHVHNTYAGKYAIRKDNWLLIDCVTGSMTKMPDWYYEQNDYKKDDMPKGGLFDMSKDIGQRENCIDKYPEKASELRELLKKIREQGHSSPRFD